MNWKNGAEWALFPEKFLKESELQVLSLKAQLLRKESPEKIFESLRSISSKPYQPFFEQYDVSKPKSRDYLMKLSEQLNSNAFNGTRELLRELIALEDGRLKLKQRNQLDKSLDESISKQIIRSLESGAKQEDFSAVPALMLLREFEVRQ